MGSLCTLMWQSARYIAVFSLGPEIAIRLEHEPWTFKDAHRQVYWTYSSSHATSFSFCTTHSHPPEDLLCLLKCISFTALVTAQFPRLVGDYGCSDGTKWQWGKIIENTQRKSYNSSHLGSNCFNSGKVSQILFIIYPFKKCQNSHSRIGQLHV